MTLAAGKADNAPHVLALPLRRDAVAFVQRGKEHMAGHSHSQAFLARYVADNNPIAVCRDFWRTGTPRNPVWHIAPILPRSRSDCDTPVNAVNGVRKIFRVNERLGPFASKAA